MPQYERQHVLSAGTEGHANPQLPRALSDQVRYHAIQPHGRQQQRNRSESANQEEIEPLRSNGVRQALLEGLDLRRRKLLVQC